jgi:hypothetical protein
LKEIVLNGFRFFALLCFIFATVLPPAFAQQQRVNDGLLTLYTFDEASGDTVYDVSGVGAPVDLNIEKASEVYWAPGTLSFPTPNLAKSINTASKISDSVRANNG